MIQLSKYREILYAIFRISVGLMFMHHGVQKLFGTSFPEGIFLLAGIIEFFGGIAIALGLFTRLVAAIAGIEMIFAYFMAHISKGILPLNNGGEPAMLFLAAFLVMIGYGNGRWNAEEMILKKETFR